MEIRAVELFKKVLLHEVLIVYRTFIVLDLIVM